MPLGAQTIIGRVFYVALALVALVVVASGLIARDLYHTNADRAATTDRLQALDRLAIVVLNAETNHRAYLLTQDATFEGRSRQYAEQARTLVAAWHGGAHAPAIRAHDIDAVRDAIVARLDALAGIRDAFERGGHEETAPLIAQRNGTIAMERFTVARDHVVEIETAHLADLRHRSGTSGTLLFYLLGAGALLNLLLLGAVYYAMRSDLRAQSRLLGQLKRTGGQLGYLNEMSGALLSCTSQAEANRVTRHFLGLLLPGTAGELYMYRASRNQLELQTTWGDPPGPVPDAIHADECWALRRGDTHLAREGSDLRCDHVSDDATRSCCVPMMALGESIGLLHVLCDEDDYFDGEALRLVETVSAQIASAMANLNLRAALRSQSIKDPLTGLYNRRYLEETMQREELRARREGVPVSLVMVDLDRFKALNDEHGHQAGDLVLKRVGGELAHGIRGEDIACRYGGEEFTLVLPGATLDDAVARAERLRAAVESLGIPAGGQELRVTASFGVANFPSHGNDWQRVLELADAALYQAKREGRNRVVAAVV